ncbi:MAG: CBS domain-containing protein, partial [Bacteroidetes bacterium]
APVSTIMTKDLITVNPEDSLEVVKKHFDEKPIHHIPVVRFQEIVGLISIKDLQFFLRGTAQNPTDTIIEEMRLRSWKAKDIMTTKLAKVDVEDSIRTVVDIFKLNRIHALPVLKDAKLVGIVTTHDIIARLADEPISLEDYQNKN